MSLSFAALAFDYRDANMASAREIAAAKMMDGKVVDVFQESFEPGSYSFTQVWSRAHEFIGQLPLVAFDAVSVVKTLVVLWSEEGTYAQPLPYLSADDLVERITGRRSSNLPDYVGSLGLQLPEIATTLDRAVAGAESMRRISELAETGSVLELVQKARIKWGTVSSSGVLG